MEAAVIQHGDDKWCRDPIVIVAIGEAEQAKKIGDFLREALADDDIAKIMHALHESEEGEGEMPEEPTAEEIAQFRGSVDAKTLIDAYDEHVCPDHNPWDLWHIN